VLVNINVLHLELKSFARYFYVMILCHAFLTHSNLTTLTAIEYSCKIAVAAFICSLKTLIYATRCNFARTTSQHTMMFGTFVEIRLAVSSPRDLEVNSEPRRVHTKQMIQDIVSSHS
jgi:hypothetical protein